MNLVRINDLYVEYKSKKGIFGEEKTIHAVNGVSLDIKKGEILAVAGESGCGKSTLAKAVIQLEPAKSGEIYFNDIDTLSLNKKSLKNFRKQAQRRFLIRIRWLSFWITLPPTRTSRRQSSARPAVPLLMIWR